MQKRILGFVLAVLGFGGMALAGYIFVTGTGGRTHLLEVTAYMIAGAICFFSGINYIYESRTDFGTEHTELNVNLDEIPPIQEQWRSIQVVKPTSSNVITANAMTTSA